LKKPPKISFLIRVSVYALPELHLGISANLPNPYATDLPNPYATDLPNPYAIDLPNPYTSHKEKNSKNLPDPE